eukprot:GHVT01101180.1.p2 GENE.GHVT01101180.1~~GHVT01101180.1.p2  ORF type:complete len:368 (-),score=104.62 GHVT01101180.1:913-1962(-)
MKAAALANIEELSSQRGAHQRASYTPSLESLGDAPAHHECAHCGFFVFHTGTKAPPNFAADPLWTCPRCAEPSAAKRNPPGNRTAAHTPGDTAEGNAMGRPRTPAQNSTQAAHLRPAPDRPGAVENGTQRKHDAHSLRPIKLSSSSTIDSTLSPSFPSASSPLSAASASFFPQSSSPPSSSSGPLTGSAFALGGLSTKGGLLLPRGLARRPSPSAPGARPPRPSVGGAAPPSPFPRANSPATATPEDGPATGKAHKVSTSPSARAEEEGEGEANAGQGGGKAKEGNGVGPWSEPPPPLALLQPSNSKAAQPQRPHRPRRAPSGRRARGFLKATRPKGGSSDANTSDTQE